MSWNFRILKKDGLFSFHEVYYNKDGGIVGYCESASLGYYVEEVGELKSILEHMLKDLERFPVLEADKIEFKDPTP